jgi:branched-chain amino acid transport system permease protein
MTIAPEEALTLVDSPAPTHSRLYRFVYGETAASRRDPVPLAMGLFIAVAGTGLVVGLNGQYFGTVVGFALAYAIVAIGMVVQLGYARQLAFSQTVFMGVGAYGTGILETKYNFGTAETVVCVLAIGFVSSLLIGSIVTRAPGLALALATLLLPLFVSTYLGNSNYFGSFTGILNINPLWGTIANYNDAMTQTSVIAVLFLALVTMAALRIMRSGVGLQLMAMSEDERLAAGLGTSLRQRRLEVFVFGSVVATLGGIVLASAQGDATYFLVAESAQITLLIILFVPGRKNVLAVIGGAILVEYLSTSSDFMSTNLATFEAIVLVVILLIEPNGFVALVARIYRFGYSKIKAARSGLPAPSDEVTQ